MTDVDTPPINIDLLAKLVVGQLAPALAEATETISVSRDRAAVLVDVSPAEIDRAIARGDLTARKLGRRVLIRYSDLDAWISSVEPVKAAS